MARPARLLILLYLKVAMLSQTTITALQSLLYILLHEGDGPHAPTAIAAQLGASTMYLGKIHTQLVKANILRAHRGARGGMTLARPAEQITLLEVVEACEGRILGDYCQPHDDLDVVCAFHAAMHGVQKALIDTLGAWTLEDLRTKPQPAASICELVKCRMAPACRPRL